MVCTECVEGGPFYSLDRSVPAIPLYGNISNRPLVDQRKLPTKMHLDESQGRFGQTHGSADPPLAPLATAFLRVSTWWAMMLLCRCWGFVGRFGLVCGPLLHVLHRTRSSATLSAYSSCFFSYSGLCAPEKINSPK